MNKVRAKIKNVSFEECYFLKSNLKTIPAPRIHQTQPRPMQLIERAWLLCEKKQSTTIKHDPEENTVGEP